MINMLLLLLLPLSLSSAMIDEHMTCDSLGKMRTARVLEQIPCDMTKVAFCAKKGAAYPE